MFRLDSDSIAVWDSRLSRISVYHRSGEFVRSFSLSGAERRYRAAELYEDGALLAMTSITFNPSSESGLRREISDYVLLGRNGDSVGFLGSFVGEERFVRTSGGGVAVSSLLFGRSTHRAVYRTSLFVGTNDAYAIDQYDREGRQIRSIRRDVSAIPVTDEMFAAEVQSRLERMREEFQEIMQPLFDEMPKPQSLPYYSAIEADPDGYVWVRRYSGLTAPVFEWTVFDSTGGMLGDVTFPFDFTTYEIGREYILGRWRDEFDVEYVRLYRLTRTEAATKGS